MPFASFHTAFRSMRFVCAFALLVNVVSAPVSRGFDIIFNYDFDTNNFFGTAGSAQRTALEQAGAFYESIIGDDLDAIDPTQDTSTWQAIFKDPTATTNDVSVTDLVVPADTIFIYVGSEDRGAGNLGLGAPGGFSATPGSQAFYDALTTRGESGITFGTPGDDTDFAPWGGMMSFNEHSSVNWTYDTGSEPGPGEVDFYSVALHEIAHVLGFGTAESFERLVSGSDFIGANAQAENGDNPVPLVAENHVDPSVMSTVFGTATSQQSLMVADLTDGTRNLLTDLDAAMLEDTGWEVIPEPGSAMLLLGGLSMLLFRRGRRQVA
ncbi:MAG: PEP-CTERM sorting domain-containing protein [Verrucomicrobiales bacterium]|nr:PEP-CTERM sorting domain-containing protein [Verrucomicrobiales bacterium]